MSYSAGPAAALVKENNVLCSLPEICLRLRHVLADPGHRRRQVAEIILHDPALSARLLRIVNSAYYGMPAPVKDISQALGIIGEHELNNLAVATAIVRGLGALQPGFALRPFWKASIFAAILASNLHERCRGCSKEELFLAGLLLDIGKLLLYMKEPQLYATVTAGMIATGRDDYVIEKQLLGYDHCEVGAALAASWNFSALLQHCIATHHLHPDANPGELAPLLYVVSWCRDRIDLDDNSSGEQLLALVPPRSARPAAPGCR